MSWTLLLKYLSQECNSAEKRIVEQWLEADSQNREFMDSLEKIWEVTPEHTLQIDAKAAWTSFRRRVLDKKEALPKNLPVADKSWQAIANKHTAQRHRGYGGALAYSLAVAALVLIAFLFYYYIPVIIEMPQSQPELTMEEIVTDRGQRTTFQLSDGTRVQLNADSRIKIPGKFMEASRKVYLEGEAYFEVTHNPDKPFVVHTENAFARVLGTKFGIHAYRNEDRVQVVVNEGKVALSPSRQRAGQSNQISKNQVGFLSKNGESNVSQADDLKRYLGWKDGQLVFRDAPFGEIKRRLERWYDIEIKLKGSSLASWPLTASFQDEPMIEVLNVIALSMELTYERQGRTFIFRKKEQ